MISDKPVRIVSSIHKSDAKNMNMICEMVRLAGHVSGTVIPVHGLPSQPGSSLEDVRPQRNGKPELTEYFLKIMFHAIIFHGNPAMLQFVLNYINDHYEPNQIGDSLTYLCECAKVRKRPNVVSEVNRVFGSVPLKGKNMKDISGNMVNRKLFEDKQVSNHPGLTWIPYFNYTFDNMPENTGISKHRDICSAARMPLYSYNVLMYGYERQLSGEQDDKELECNSEQDDNLNDKDDSNF